MRTIVPLILLSLVGCGSPSGPADGGGMDTGAAPVDASDTDTGDAPPDSGAPSDDAATADAGATSGDAATAHEDAATAHEDATTGGDAGTTGDDAGVAGGDASIDCSLIGCGAPPVCGEACTAPCGCCGCGGSGTCEGGVAVNCAGDCYERTDCRGRGCTVDGDGVASCGSCGAIEAEYEALVGAEAMRCGGPDTCHVLFGHCGVGLGDCHYGVNTGVTQDELDAVAARWTAQGCDVGRPVCRCAPPPEVRCDAGGCLTF